MGKNPLGLEKIAHLTLAFFGSAEPPIFIGEPLCSILTLRKWGWVEVGELLGTCCRLCVLGPLSAFPGTLLRFLWLDMENRSLEEGKK